jgi:hypothetical protein
MLTSSTIHENYIEMREEISQRLLTDFNIDKEYGELGRTI